MQWRSAAASCALACVVLGLGALMVGEIISAPSPSLLTSTRLHEDVTSPHVKSQFLSKFQAAREHHAGKALLFNPVSQLASAQGGKKKLTAAQKAVIAAKMKALRQKIMGDFSSMTHFGKQVDCR